MARHRRTRKLRKPEHDFQKFLTLNENDEQETFDTLKVALDSAKDDLVNALDGEDERTDYVAVYQLVRVVKGARSTVLTELRS